MLQFKKDIRRVITHINMPEMDGKELIRCIRISQTYDDIAIVAATQSGEMKAKNL